MTDQRWIRLYCSKEIIWYLSNFYSQIIADVMVISKEFSFFFILFLIQCLVKAILLSLVRFVWKRNVSRREANYKFVQFSPSLYISLLSPLYYIYSIISEYNIGAPKLRHDFCRKWKLWLLLFAYFWRRSLPEKKPRTFTKKGVRAITFARRNKEKSEKSAQ